MACQMCSRNSHCHQSLNGIHSCDAHHYSDVPYVDNLEPEPEAPTLSLGNRILWLTEARAASGIVKWIGRIPSISTNWTAGVEFDNVMPGGGNGGFRGRQYFQSRIGHAVFLPVADLIKVDSDNSVNSGERTSFFGRLQDSCSNFAHRRRRDATFGHFKQDFCSSCTRNEFPNYSHYCHSAPVYDRITTRRSMCYDDHAYEMCNPRGAYNLAPNSSNHFHRNSGLPCEGDNRSSCVVVSERIPSLQTVNRAADEYPNEDCAVNMRIRRDSFFNPRPSLSFINGFNGFKEWVTCLVLGTNRRKRKNKIVFKDTKSVTSVLFAQNAQSITGQRLSSFADYATVAVNRSGKQKKALTKSDRITEISGEASNVEEIDSPSDDVTGNGHSNSCTKVNSSHRSENKILSSNGHYSGSTKENIHANRNENKNNISSNDHLSNSKKGNKSEKKTDISSKPNNAQSRVKRKKKRPAPLPPVIYSTSSTNSRKLIENGITVKKENTGSKERETRYKIVRSSSFRIHATTQKRYRKKRRAPPPPVVTNAIPAEQTNKVVPAIISVPSSSKSKAEKSDQNFQKVILSEVVRNGSLTKPKPKKAKHKVIYSKVRKGAFVKGYSDSGEESGSEDSKNSSYSVSFSDNDSDSDRYGLVKYGIINKVNASENSLNLPSSSNFVQYAGENSDVCLKISIQKTETNVVTVEEVSKPCSTTHYTIEEDSSSSELSDIPVVKVVEKKAITNEEQKANSADTSSVSTVEENGDKSKTIFEELQIQPPVKGSVKDFVNAFNMLAYKDSIAPQGGRRSSNGNLPYTKVQNGASEINKSKDSQSFPTKWEYQNKAPIYAVNKFLLPIAEESLNETSEQDGNVSVDDSKSSSPKFRNINGVASKALEASDSSSKKCSHCSEAHTQPSNNGVNSKNLKKRTDPHKVNIVYDSVKNEGSSQASMAALSSLLKDKPPLDLKGDKLKTVGSGKNSTKLDQPIMVGLYIEDKSSHRGPIPLLVTPSMSLKKLKRQIEKEYEFPRHQQCWILGESFAVADEASLASYGVTEPGCPILLYVMAKDSKSHSLPARTSLRTRANPEQDISDSSEEETELKSKVYKKGNLKTKHDMLTEVDVRKQANLLGAIPKTDKVRHIPTKAPPRVSSRKRETKSKKTKSEFHKAWEAEFEKKADYHTLLALDDVDLVSNVEKFECPVCFLDVEAGDGAVLQECLHSFCKECLAGAIQFSETAVVKCPFRNDEYSCECHLQEREVKSLVTPEVYDRHLQRSMALAESQALDSFHCKTPDCPGWCLFEDNVNTFLCPVCKHTNCLTCAAIHEGKNCRQYQDDVSFRCDSSEEARKTKEYLQNMVDNGEAMRCPQCQVILMKKWGCDWLKCSMCHTEVCWVTKGPRWGPGGRGDTSGGCKCMVNGVRCHPKCSYCH